MSETKMSEKQFELMMEQLRRQTGYLEQLAENQDRVMDHLNNIAELVLKIYGGK